MDNKLFFAFFLVFLFVGFGFASTTPNVLYDWSWSGVSVDACEGSNEKVIFCDATQFSISLLKKLNSVSAGSSFEFDAFLMGDGFSQDFREDFDHYYSNISFFDSPFFYINETDGLRHYFTSSDLFVFKLNGESWVDGVKLVPGEYRVSVDVPIDFNPGVLGVESVVVDFEFLSSPEEESALLFLPFDGEIGFFNGDKDRVGYGVVFSSGGEIALNDKVIFDSTVSGGVVEVSDFVFVDDFVELNDFYKKKQLLKIVDNEGDFSFEFSSSVPTPVFLEVNKVSDEKEFSVFYNIFSASGATVNLDRDYFLVWDSALEKCADLSGANMTDKFIDFFDRFAEGEGLDRGNVFAVDWADSSADGKVVVESVVYRNGEQDKFYLNLFDLEEGVSSVFYSPFDLGEKIFLSGSGNELVDSKSKSLFDLIKLVERGFVEVVVEDNVTVFQWNEVALRNLLSDKRDDFEAECIPVPEQNQPDVNGSYFPYYVLTQDDLIPSSLATNLPEFDVDDLVDFELVYSSENDVTVTGAYLLDAKGKVKAIGDANAQLAFLLNSASAESSESSSSSEKGFFSGILNFFRNIFTAISNFFSNLFSGGSEPSVNAVDLEVTSSGNGIYVLFEDGSLKVAGEAQVLNSEVIKDAVDLELIIQKDTVVGYRVLDKEGILRGVMGKSQVATEDFGTSSFEYAVDFESSVSGFFVLFSGGTIKQIGGSPISVAVKGKAVDLEFFEGEMYVLDSFGNIQGVDGAPPIAGQLIHIFDSKKAKALEFVGLNEVSAEEDIEVSIATLKDSYMVGEVIGLTDPPEQEITDAEQVFYGSGLVLSTTNFETPQQNEGYIVKLKDKSIIEKKVELDAQGNISKSSISANLDIHEQNLLDEHSAFKYKMNQVLSKGLKKTGSVVVKREYIKVFNGFALDIDDATALELKLLDEVEEIYPNYAVEAVLMDSVPQIQGGVSAGQLGANGDNCTVSGEECLTGEGVTIAIIDTGIDYTHPDLGGCFGAGCKIIGGYDFVNDDADPMDDHGHGTHCAGIAAGNGVLKGVAPEAKIYAYKVLDNGGSGNWDEIIAAIERAVDPNQDGDFTDHVDIISLSLGGAGNSDDAISIAVDNAVDAGVVAVIAAGNSGSNERTIGSPGTARKAITVGAIDGADYMANFSSMGPVVWINTIGIEKAIIKPDIVAPGFEICSAQWEDAWIDTECIDSEHTAISGTSMATPHVAGAVALIKQKNSDWSPAEIKSVLMGTAEDIGYEVITQGAGKVNVPDTLRVNQKPLIAELNVENYAVSGIINISGIAKGEAFEKFDVYYSKKDETEEKWELICSGTSQVDTGVLCRGFDTSILEQGEYMLKLSVNGNQFSTSTYGLVRFNNFEIISVGKNQGYLNGYTDILGEIKLKEYDAYKIIFDNPEQEEQELCFVNGKATTEILCSFDFSQLSDGKYYLKLLISKEGVWVGSETIPIAVIQNLMDGWPVHNSCNGSNVLSPIKIDGVPKIFSADPRECYPGWSLGGKIISYDNFTNKTVLYELFKDGQNITNTNHMSGRLISTLDQKLALSSLSKYIGVVDDSGNFVDNWPYEIDDFEGIYEGAVGSFIISENNLFSVRVISTNQLFDGLSLYKFDKKGNLLYNVPIEKEEGFEEWAISSAGGILIEDDGKEYIGLMVALFNNWGDLNGKLFFDIYSVSDGKRIKRSLLHDGLDKKINYQGFSFTSGDLDGDGSDEIAVGYMVLDLDKFNEDRYNLDAYESHLKILDSTGNILSDIYNIKGYFLNKIRIGRLNTKNPVIIFHLEDTWPTTYDGQRIVGVNLQGDILVDINLEDHTHLVEGLSIGDVTGDSKQDIVIAYRPRWWMENPSGILIYDGKGNLEKEILIPTFGTAEQLGWGNDPLLTDFDLDGKVDIILKTLHLQKNTSDTWQSNIFVFETNTPYDSSTMEWPMFQHDPQYTGRYTKPLPQSKIVNNAEEDVSGLLSFKLLKLDGGSWNDYTTVHEQQVTIPANDLIKLDVGNSEFPGFNNLGVKVNEPGEYKVVVSFTVNGADYESEWEFSVEKALIAVCGNSICEEGETPENCVEDCGVPLRENKKDMSKYSEKEAFLISDKDWRSVLSLVPVTTWTTREGEIEKYPSLVFHEEDAEDRVLTLDKQLLLNDVRMTFRYISPLIFEERPNSKSFEYSFDVPERAWEYMNNSDVHGSTNGILIKFKIKTETEFYGDMNPFIAAFKEHLILNGCPVSVPGSGAGYGFKGDVLDLTLYITFDYSDVELFEFGNLMTLEEFDDEHYLIEELKIYPEPYYMNNIGEGFENLTVRVGDECNNDWVEFCITDVQFDKQTVLPGEEFSYTYSIQNITSSTIDLLSENQDFEIYVFEPLDNLKVGNISFPSRIVEPGETTSVTINTLYNASLDYSFDADSVFHFLRQYSPEELTIVGETTPDFDNLIISPSGADLSEGVVQIIDSADYFSFWLSFEDIVFVHSENYKDALVASTFASSLNAPLVFLDESNMADYYSMLSSRNAILIGDFSEQIRTFVSTNARTIKEYSLSELNNNNAPLTDSKKFILVNPNDLDMHRSADLKTDASGSIVNNLYGKASLISPFLASAKQEFIIPVSSANSSEVNAEFKSNFDELYSSPPESQCRLGDSCSSGFFESVDQFYFAENEISFLYQPSVVPDLEFRLQEYPRLILVGQETPLIFRIINNSITPAQNVVANLYIIDPNEDYSETLIHTQEFDYIELIELIEINFLPEKPGEFQLKFELIYPEDPTPEDNFSSWSIVVQDNAPDLSVRLFSEQDNFIVNQDNILKVDIFNHGPQPAENFIVNISELIYSEGEEVEVLIDEITVDYLSEYDPYSDDWDSSRTVLEFIWHPIEIGGINITAKVELADDWNEENNEDYEYFWVTNAGPDISIWNSWDWNNRVILNEEISIPCVIKNYGTETSEEILVNLYKVSNVDGEEQLILISSIEVQPLNPTEKTEVSFNWIPETEGYHDLKIEINSAGDVYSDNDYSYVYLNVLLNGPDLRGTMDWRWDDLAILNQDIVIFSLVENNGTTIASDILVEVYEIDGEINTLVYSENIGELDVGEFFEFDFSWHAASEGHHRLKLIVTTEGEVNENDNVDYASIYVTVEGIDVEVDYVGFKRLLLLNQENEVMVTIRNRGSEIAENIFVEVFNGEELIDSSSISSLAVNQNEYLNFSWTPTEAGEHQIRVTATIDGDINLENNEYQITAEVGISREIIFEANIQDGYERYIGFAVNGSFFENFFVQSQTPVTVNISHSSNTILVGYIEGSIQASDKAVYTIFEDSTLVDEANITSNYFEKELNLGDKILHAFYYNEPEWEFESQRIYFNYKDLSSLNIQNVDSLTIYSCSDWGTTSESCLTEWVEISGVSNYSYDDRILLDAYASAEAFAFGEPKEIIASSHKSNIKDFVDTDLLSKISKRSKAIASDASKDYSSTYTISFAGAFINCSSDYVKVEVYSGAEFIHSENILCADVDELLMLPNRIPRVYLDKIDKEIDPGQIILKFDSDIILSDYVGFGIEKVVGVSYDNSEYINLFYCENITDECAPDTSIIELSNFVADGDSQLTFNNVDTEQKYNLVVSAHGFDIDDLNVFIGNYQLGYFEYIGSSAKKVFSLPAELISEEIVVSIIPVFWNEEYNYESIYKVNAKLIPELSEHYLTIMASPDAIQMWENLPQTGFYQFREELDNRLYGNYYGEMVDFSTGRIFGLTVSDISAYVARSIFFEDLPKEKIALVIGREAPNSYGDSTDSVAMEQLIMNNYWSDSIDNEFDETTFCFGHEGCDPDPTIKGSYVDSDLVFYLDHGSSKGFASEAMDSAYLISNEVNLKPLTVIDIACSTCAYAYTNNENLFCTQNLRRGSMVFQGAVSVSYWEKYFDIMLNEMYLEGDSIGTAFKHAKNSEYARDLYYTIIGDPTFKPKWWSD